MMACPSLLAPVHSDLPLLVLRAAKISPSVHPPHVSLSLSVGDGLSAKRAVRLIHFRICPIQAKKAHNCYPCITKKKSGQQICLMKLKMSTRVYENWAPTSLGAQIRFRVLMKLGYLHLNCHWHSFRCISSLFPQKGDFCDINHAERGSGRVWMCRPQTDHT